MNFRLKYIEVISMKKDLTEKQQAVYDVLERAINEEDYIPSIHQLCELAGLSSVSTIHHHLKVLEEKGYIQRDAGRSRSIRLTQEKADGNKYMTQEIFVSVPIIGEIAAGEPIFAYENYQDSVMLARDMIGANEAFILRVRGKSMIEDLIDDGDMVVVKKQETANNGDIVVALLPENNEATLKRFYKENNRFRLQPANSTMQPIYVKEVKIQGKVIGLLRFHDQKAVSYR
jgi:repressor LexA